MDTYTAARAPFDRYHITRQDGVVHAITGKLASVRGLSADPTTWTHHETAAAFNSGEPVVVPRTVTG